MTFIATRAINVYVATKWLINNNLDKFFKDVTNVKLPSYLYIDNSGNTNSIVRIRESDYHYKLGEVFKVFIPQNVYLDRRNNKP